MSPLDDTDLVRIQEICQRFIAELRVNPATPLDRFLAEVGVDESPSLFRELLAAKLRFAGNEDKLADLQDLLNRFPQYAEIVREIFSSTTDSVPDELVVTADYPGSIPSKPNPSGESTEVIARSTGRYRLLQIVGKGGFGEVWKAYDPQLDRIVAVKLPRQDRVFSDEQLNDFLVEARRVARLKIAGVVAVHDVGQDGASHFIVSDFVDGETLADQMKRDRLSCRASARIIADIAETLHRAHLQDIVHRDVKPNNILIDKSGTVFLTDFGLAINEVEQLAESEAVLGTFAYMPPEQARGSSNRVDGRADIYSLGVVLYQLLTNRLPFVATTAMEYRNQILQRDVRPLRTIDDTIPIELERICLRCLAKSPTDRYSTAKDLAHDLRQWIAEVDVKDRKTASPAYLWPVITIAVVLVAVIVVAISVGRNREPQVQPVTRPEQKAAVAENPKADGSSKAEKTTSPVERIWLDQLGQSPRELFLPGYRAGGTLGFRSDLQAFEISSEPERLVQLGVLEGRSCRIGITIEQPVWNGATGVFWGYHEVEAKEGRGAQWQSITGARHYPPDGVPVYRVVRRLVQTPARSGITVTVKDLGYMDVRFPEDSRPVRLEFELHKDQLVRATWNGEDLPITSDSLNRRTNPADYAGPWGVYSQRATTWFRHPSLHFSEGQQE